MQTSPYGHALVVGIDKYPRMVIKKISQKKIAKRPRLKPFIRVVNYNHIMPTRYTLDADLKNIVITEKLDSKTKRERQERKQRHYLRRGSRQERTSGSSLSCNFGIASVIDRTTCLGCELSSVESVCVGDLLEGVVQYF
ncbi:hypothetical protein GOP47_0030947 [Adiantum capillus-veneris]|nr:hypothetical protein GOP47_0030947 [Adiantum capillus-veneris]